MYKITSHDVASGYPGYIGPSNIQFSPDGQQLTYLYPDKAGKRQVFSLSLSHGHPAAAADSNPRPRQLLSTGAEAEALSLEEQLRRERMRLFTDGIASFEWATQIATDSSMRMLVPCGEKLFIFEQKSDAAASNRCVEVYGGAIGAAIDAHLSPDGTALAFVLKNDLYLLELDLDAPSLSQPVRLTFRGEIDGHSCGVADFIAQEEMDRYRGFWWSPDSASIAFVVNDESFIPQYQILHQGKDDPQHSEQHRYPFAGKRNAVLADDEDYRFHQPLNQFEHYVGRVGWWADGAIMAQIQTRSQQLLQLLHIDVTSGERRVLLEEETSVWINLHELLYCFGNNFRYQTAKHAHCEGDRYFLWGSERTGLRQLFLYKYGQSGAAICLSEHPIGGDGVVFGIEAVDEVRCILYFSGNHGCCTERHLFRTHFSSTSPPHLHRMTSMPGSHSCSVLLFNADANLNDSRIGFVAVCSSSITSPLSFRILSIQLDEVVDVLEVENSLHSDGRLLRNPNLLPALRPPNFFSIRSQDQSVELMCAVYLPDGVEWETYAAGGRSGEQGLPAVVSVYGGPHVQCVANSWLLTADLRAQRLAQRGFVVLKCDNRGSYHRGLAFEGAIQGDMGRLEVHDQSTALRHLVSLGLVDAQRVGIFGWSYGGYLSVMSLCRAPEVFRCAVAGAPVTSWDGYDTHYTERYMGQPEDNAQGYLSSSVMSHVAQMQGQLLLVHGLIDENVHFRHTARLVNALVQARKRYELVLFPCERHSPHRLQDKIYLEDIMQSFFERVLLAEQLPWLMLATTVQAEPVLMVAHL